MALIGADEPVRGVGVLGVGDGCDFWIGLYGEALFGVIRYGGLDVGEGGFERAETLPFEL